MPTIDEIVSEMDLAHRRSLETICHTRNSKEDLKSYTYQLYQSVFFHENGGLVPWVE